MSERQTHRAGRMDYEGETAAIRNILKNEGIWGALDMFAHPSFNTLDRMIIREATRTALLVDGPRHSSSTVERDNEYLLALEYMDQYINADLASKLARSRQVDSQTPDTASSGVVDSSSKLV